MAQIIKTEKIALSETEGKALILVTNMLEGISRETSDTNLDNICNNVIAEINDFWEYVENL